MQLTGHEIAMAFNQQNEKKGWSARTNTRPTAGLDVVHFSTPQGMCSLAYDANTRRFQITYNKVQAAWGDYVKSAAKALYYVLTVLKSAGLPFDAPLSPAGIRLIVTASDDSAVYVEWPSMHVEQLFSTGVDVLG